MIHNLTRYARSPELDQILQNRSQLYRDLLIAPSYAEDDAARRLYLLYLSERPLDGSSQGLLIEPEIYDSMRSLVEDTPLYIPVLNSEQVIVGYRRIG